MPKEEATIDPDRFMPSSRCDAMQERKSVSEKSERKSEKGRRRKREKGGKRERQKERGIMVEMT